MARIILSIDDLSDAEIAHILARSSEFEHGKRPQTAQRRIVGLLFQQTSLRTRVGFAAAAARLGWECIDVSERRHDPTSMIESWHDTLRTLSGYVDTLVSRPGVHLSREELETSLEIPYINGGSIPPDAEHPSQSLIDLYTIEAERGTISDLSIAICGDLRMRAVRSLVRLLARRTPRRLVFISVPELVDVADLPSAVKAFAEFQEPWQLGDIDVLYVAGIPHQAIPETRRDTLRVTSRTLAGLKDEAIVLSPLPVIDEMTEEAKMNPQVRMFAQSDHGLYVRMALLELAIS